MNSQQHHQLEEEPVSIFCSYAPEDGKAYIALEIHLSLMKKQHLIRTWSTKDILAGSNPRQETEKALQTADIFLLLISPDYISSQLYEEHLLPALKRLQQGEIRLVPVYLRPVASLELSELRDIELLPKEKQPISAWKNNTDRAFASVARDIRQIVEMLQALKHDVETLKHPETGQITTPGPEETNKTLHQEPQTKPARQANFAQGYALIIGINHYQNIPELSEAILKDALKLHDVVRDPDLCAYPDKNVRLLLNEQATPDGIRAGLRWLARVAGAGATALIYFSGHGLNVFTEEQEKFYLLTYESDFASLPQTAIDAEEFTSLQKNIAAQRLLVCLDCCHAEGMSELKGPGATFPHDAHTPDERDFARLAQGTGRVILAASLKDESAEALRAMNNSLFTYYLLEALRGKAHVRNDGLIRVMDVFHYISDSIKAQNQHVLLKGEVQNNFPIALYQGGAEIVMNVSEEPHKNLSMVNERKLREAIESSYSREELALLCANVESDLANNGISLSVNLEFIGSGGGLPKQVFDLIGYLKRRGLLEYLVRAVREERPGLI